METPEERIWILLSRKFSNSIRDVEESELRQLLRHHPDAQYTFEILGKIWNPQADSHPVNEKFLFDDGNDTKEIHLQYTDSTQARERRLIKRRRMLGYAAAGLLLLVGILIGLLYLLPGKQQAGSHDLYTISTKAGEKKKTTLPDGTEVWLNAGSRLEYPVGFKSDSIRTVTLSGEAYFKVKHDDKHPFIIYTKAMEIRDIGTEFNVRSYPDEALTEAALISGSIEVSLPANERKILLKPNEKIVVYRNKHFEKYSITDSMKKDAPVQDIQINGYQIATIEKNTLIHTYPETAWMQNDLVFRNQSFEELAKIIERKYAYKIIITDNRIKQYKLTGIFRDETLEQALMELQVIAPFDYTIKDSTVTIFNK